MTVEIYTACWSGSPSAQQRPEPKVQWWQWCLSNGTAMIGGALLRGGIMNGTLVHGRMKEEEAR